MPDTNIGYHIMSILDKLFNRKETRTQDVEPASISSSQYRGRWYGSCRIPWRYRAATGSSACG